MTSVSRVFGTRAEVLALDRVDLHVGGSEMVAIVGPSGSGKSTLLNILGLLDQPSEGSYLLNGADMTSAGSRERAQHRARRIGFVFQEFRLLPQLPVIDNVALGGSFQGFTRRESYELAVAALVRLGVGHRMTASTGTLSGGERQRVAVARAIVGDKKLLLCDEPTGNLDRTNTQALLEVLEERVAEGVSVVVVTHDNEVASRAQRRYRIVDGRLGEV